MIVCTFNPVYCSQFALQSTSLVASVMLSIYAKLSISVLAVRERATVNMQGTVFNLARLKIVPSYHQGLVVSHPMPEHIEA